MWYVKPKNELYHHGIKGQKWGVRRFQNEDGSYTEAGRKRYNKIASRYDRKIEKTKKDISSFDQIRGGYKDKKGRVLLSKEDVESSVSALNQRIDKISQKKEEKLSNFKNNGTTLSDKQKKALKVGAAVTATALVAVGGYALYKSGKLDGVIAKGKELVSEQMPKLKNVRYNATDLLKRKAASNSTKIGMIGRQFVSEQTAKAKEAITNGIRDGSKELSKAGMTAAAGIAAKKISDAIRKNDQEDSEDVVKNILLTSANKAVDSFNNSINTSVTNNSSGPSKGSSVGKDISKKLGPAPQEKFSPSDETRYQAVFKSSKVNGNVEARQTVKTLRKQGYSIDQIERYVSWL